MRHAAPFGITAVVPVVDFGAVQDHVRSVIEGIAPHDSVERFESLGVRVLHAAARFVGPSEVLASGLRVRARRFVVATGSSPAAPPIPGLDTVPFLDRKSVVEGKSVLDSVDLGGRRIIKIKTQRKQQILILNMSYNQIITGI